ncbi:MULTISPECIES: metallophosphoesterase [unclassified Arthrobacter]|uniref:metallophosphoesterase n=1 Tax=unclassified Arthrobacter TaxID=235627 RepID=UPI002DFE9691|nr:MULTISPECIES: metallophosphoesterase [unclassified Arthrobacter]MEC5189821.1 putative MPP superfamily phosphohydrolase [Arthrobacter sp. MP_M4]MEC5201288.1 putative MPP superfamily phosphohydrolase [Arthrobacter sp. MP_M7]
METINVLASRARSIGRGFAVTAAAGALTGAAAAGYGLWEKNQFVLREESLPVLPAGFGPIRVLHLSDIHFVPGQDRKAAWLSSLADLAPDLVVNTGDNLSHAKAVDPVLEALRPLMAFPGVFVPGSNDYFAPRLKNPASYFAGPSSKPKEPAMLDWPRLRSGFGMGGWVDLTNRCQSLVIGGLRVDFSGVDDPHLGLEQYAGWPRGTKGQDAKPHLRIAVAHAPYQRVLDHFTADGADLLLAGHTHGGQICVPGFGALVANCDLPTWRAKGLHGWESNGRTTPVNVSGGIGTSRFAPVRIACKPEAVLLTLTARS